MSIFSQLRNAVFGDSEEEANDTDNATTKWDLSGALPALPFVRSTPTTRTLSPSESIDLPSPTRRAQPAPRKQRVDANRSRPTSRSHKTADERRLVADYDIPADRVSVPDPVSYFQPRGSAMGKPASGSAYQPINTLNGSQITPRSNKHTYGRLSRSNVYPPRISQSLGFGQLAFLEHHQSNQSKSPGTSARETPSRKGHFYNHTEASPAKRRKTGHVSPTEVIDFTEDDELQEVTPHKFTAPPGVSQNEAPRSVRSSQSQRSVDSGHTIPARRPASRITSESRIVDDMVKQSRKINKQPSPDRQSKPSYGRTVSGSVTPHTQDTSIHTLGEERTGSVDAARTSIFGHLEDGVPNGALKEPRVTSHHFPNARINESTADVGERTLNARNADGPKPTPHLRDFKAAQRGTIADDTISEDELAMEPPPKKNEMIRRQASPSKISQTANRAAKRASRGERSSQGWPLIWARSHAHAVLWGSSTDYDGPPVLQLKQGEEPGTWDIIEIDASHPLGTIRAHITPRDVIKGQADDIGRIRLEGSRQQDGNCPIFDMDFLKPDHFRKFRDEHAKNLAAPGKILQWDEKQMEALFRKSLHKNDKVGTSALTADHVMTTNDETETLTRPSKTPLLDQIRASPQSAKSNTTVTAKDSTGTGTVTSTRTSARPTRSTRSAVPVHDVEELYPEAVEKHSVVHGLGPEWLTPLTYGNGRQRTVVDFNDLPRLDEDEMLNDSLIDFYMIWLSEKYKVPEDKVYFFNTFFYSKLTEKTGRSSMNYKAVERWTAKVDIFKYDYIVVPIHEATHWYLAIICNVANIDRTPVQEDFDEDAAEDLTNNEVGSAEIHEPADVATRAEPQSVAAANATDSPNENPNEQGGNEANLFDEEARLNLIDRDDIGTDGGPGKAKHDSSRPQSPGENDPIAQPVVDQLATSSELLGKTNVPSEKKKKSKRKPPVVKRDPSKPVVIVLDSLGNNHSNVVRSLKDWLAAEGHAKRGMEVVIKENGVYPKGEQIPTQSNWTDCGVYVLGYVEKFFQNPDEFKRRLLTGEMTSEDDWPELKPKDMRNSLRNILLKIADEQQLTVPKKRKGKKGAATTKEKPILLGVPPANSASTLLSNHQVATAASGSTKTELAGSATRKMEHVVEETQQPKDLSRPRLQSPFKPEPRAEASLLGAESSTRKSPEFQVGKVSDSPPVFVSPMKRTGTSPEKQTPGRKSSPKVKIPAQSPIPQQLVQKRNHIEVSPSSANKSPHKTVHNVGHVSPRNKSRQNIDDGDDLQTPTTRKKSTSTTAEKQRSSAPTGPSLQRQRDGSSDHPIEIVDSQDARPEAPQSPKNFRNGSPAKRIPPTQSHDKNHALHHTPSVEEISPPQPRKSPRKRRQAEEAVVGHQLEAKLDAEDKARELAPPESLSRLGSYELEHMDIDSQGGDPMDYADDTIRETPEAARSSPEARWAAGQPLLL